MDPEEMEPTKPKPALRDLEPLSVTELKLYILELEGEIVRARAAILAKQSIRAGAEALFKG
jgi:uncharacterized small protein (DUF1192 family)